MTTFRRRAVSFGPYHHGQPELAFVEAFKPKAVELFVSGGRENSEFYHSKVVSIIGEIRSCYEESSMCKYSDDYVAGMMLHDAALMIIYMEVSAADETRPPDELMMAKFEAMLEHLGMLTLAVLSRDLFLLQNQIPLRVVELLIDSRYGVGEYQDLLSRYMNMAIFGEYREKRDLSEPLHLVEAIHMLVVSDCAKPEKTSRGRTWLRCFKACCPRRVEKDLETGAPPETTRGLIHRFLKSLPCRNKGAAKKDNIKKFITSFRSVTELQAKGIHFQPSPTQSLMDVSFKSNFFYGSCLQLPEWGVSVKTKVIFMNLVAYELNPNSPAYGEVVSYISFMKSLIERPEDVKELRERRIIYNMLGSDEEVFNVCKDINTHGADDPKQFGDVKDQIQAHYNSWTQTWMAELIHTNFRSPWTMTAFFAAVALLAISAGQLYYAVHPNS